MNILVAPNSYKGCLDSVVITQIINEALSEKSQLKLFLKPLSDGGDGFISVCSLIEEVNSIKDYKTIKYRDFLSDYLFIYSKNLRSIFIESAELFGLKIIPESERNPIKLSSQLLGKIIEFLTGEVSNNHLDINDVFIGVGGTATIDFGIGACSQLGLSLFGDKDEELTPFPINFIKTKSVSFSKMQLPFNIKCVVDVETELIGNPGAIEIYGEQKGAFKEDLQIIKNGIVNLLQIIPIDLDIKIPEKLNGAGGGLAAGLNLFYNAEIILARRFIIEQILYDVNLDDFDVVITGEGNFDHQSFEGKGSGVILDLFKNRKAKIILINGDTTLSDNISLPQNLTIINLIDFFESKTESMKNVELGLKKACKIILDQLYK